MGGGPTPAEPSSRLCLAPPPYRGARLPVKLRVPGQEAVIPKLGVGGWPRGPWPPTFGGDTLARGSLGVPYSNPPQDGPPIISGLDYESLWRVLGVNLISIEYYWSS